MEIRMTPIDEIVPYGNNPRNNDAAVDAVAQSISKFGFRNPIIDKGKIGNAILGKIAFTNLGNSRIISRKRRLVIWKRSPQR